MSLILPSGLCASSKLEPSSGSCDTLCSKNRERGSSCSPQWWLLELLGSVWAGIQECGDDLAVFVSVSSSAALAGLVPQSLSTGHTSVMSISTASVLPLPFPGTGDLFLDVGFAVCSFATLGLGSMCLHLEVPQLSSGGSTDLKSQHSTEECQHRRLSSAASSSDDRMEPHLQLSSAASSSDDRMELALHPEHATPPVFQPRSTAVMDTLIDIDTYCAQYSDSQSCTSQEFRDGSLFQKQTLIDIDMYCAHHSDSQSCTSQEFHDGSSCQKHTSWNSENGIRVSASHGQEYENEDGPVPEERSASLASSKMSL